MSMEGSGTSQGLARDFSGCGFVALQEGCSEGGVGALQVTVKGRRAWRCCPWAYLPWDTPRLLWCEDSVNREGISAEEHYSGHSVEETTSVYYLI